MINSILVLFLWLLISYLLGFFVTEFSSINFANKADRIFKRLFIGALISIVTFAIIRTNFHSSLIVIPVLIVGILFNFKNSYFRFNRNIKFSIKEISYDLLLLSGTGMIFWLLQSNHLIDFYTGEIKGLLYYDGSDSDTDFYIRIADYLQEFGVENKSIDVINPELYSAEPYHFFEIWAGALPIYFTGMSGTFAFILVAMPFLFCILFFQVFDFTIRILKNEDSKIRAVAFLISISYFFVSGLSILYPNQGIFKMDVYAENVLDYIKVIMVNIGLFLIIRAILTKDGRWIIWMLIFSGALYLPLMIVFAFIAGMVYLGLLWKKELKSPLKFTIVFALTGVVSLIALLFVISGNVFPELMEIQSESYSLIYSDFEFGTFINIFGKGIIQIFFILILFIVLFFLYFKNNDWKKYRNWFLYIGMFLTIPLLIYSLMHKMIDSVQFWILIFVPLVNIIIYSVLLIGMSSKKKLFLILNSSLFLFFIIYNRPFGKCDSCVVTQERILSFEKAKGENQDVIYAYMKDAKDYQTIFDYGMHIDVPAREINRITGSYKTVCLSWNQIPIQTEKDLQLLVKQVHWINPFYRFCQNNKGKNIELLKLQFMQENKIRFLIVSKNVILSQELKNGIEDSLTQFSDGSILYKIK